MVGLPQYIKFVIQYDYMFFVLQKLFLYITIINLIHEIMDIVDFTTSPPKAA